MGKKLQRTCENCGCIFDRYPSQCGDKHNAGKFCTKKCADVFRTGKPLSKEWCEKLKGHITWNKGIKIDREKYPNMGHQIKHTEESKKKCGIANIGRIAWNRGLTKENSDRVYAGERHHNWKGGVTREMDYERRKLKANGEWKKWREAVFKRDKFTCLLCGGIGTYLHPHHINSFSDFPNERLNIKNGITLCKYCHVLVHQDKEISKSGWFIRKASG